MDSNGDGIGDLGGIIRKLDYLKELGVNVIWLSPIYRSPNDDNGYDISDYCEIMEEFGTMENLTGCLRRCTREGLKLMMDLVVNHTSDEHPWFPGCVKGQKQPLPGLLLLPGWEPGGLPPNNWCSHFGFSAWEKEPEGDQYFLHLYTKKQPDLNWDNPSVREGCTASCSSGRIKELTASAWM